MTDENPHDTDDGLGERLRRLLEALDRLDDASKRAEAEGEAYGVDVDVDVEFGTLEDETEGTPDRWRASRRPGRPHPSGPEDPTPSVDYTVAVRERADGTTVTVDVGGRDEATPTPAVDGAELTLSRRGHVVERVPLPFADGVVAGQATNNGVLVVTVDQAGAGDGSGDVGGDDAGETT